MARRLTVGCTTAARKPRPGVGKRRLAARAGKIEEQSYEDRSLAYQHMVQLILWAQRDALLRIRGQGMLSNEVINQILRELDLEESRLEPTPSSG